MSTHHIVTWVRIAATGADHLATPRASYGQHRESWCGLNLDYSKTTPESGRRCKDCLRLLAVYTASATAAPPDMVEEVVIVKVTRPTKSHETAEEAIRRKMNALRSWKISARTEPGRRETDDTGSVDA